MPFKIAAIMQNPDDFKHALTIAIDNEMPWFLNLASGDAAATQGQMVCACTWNHDVRPLF